MKQMLYAVLFFLLASAGRASAQSVADTTVRFNVNGACAQCKQRIEKALKTKGVANASWDIPTHELTVTYNPSVIKLNELHAKVAAVGHDTELEKAKDDVYKDLPDCCHYRDLSPEEMAAEANEHNINGVVLTEDNKGNFAPLAGATILWEGTQTGTKTDVHGVFSIPHEEPHTKLVISYAGYHTDTIAVANMQDMQIVLAASGQLNEVKVTSRRRTVYVNQYDAFRIAKISPRELLKAACCNLSE
ncbi:MAG TPA: carboxypeptidase-like regulatory domain-containing protein, partial [Flavisolibacter sp.]|nr:carboxypeptidase-like regulatory domain-containing protein [Flavisolibacter sp.]